MTAPTTDQVWAASSERAKWAHLFRDDRPTSVCGAITHDQATPDPDRAQCPRCVEMADQPDIHDLIEATGATYRRLDFWARTGVLRIDDPKPGSGNRRTWPASEVEVARRIVAFMDAGLTLDAAAHAARNDGLLPGDGFRVSEVAA